MSPLRYEQIHGWTALHIAAYNERMDIVRLLLEWGADPTAGDEV